MFFDCYAYMNENNFTLITDKCNKIFSIIIYHNIIILSIKKALYGYVAKIRHIKYKNMQLNGK